MLLIERKSRKVKTRVVGWLSWQIRQKMNMLVFEQILVTIRKVMMSSEGFICSIPQVFLRRYPLALNRKSSCGEQ